MFCFGKEHQTNPKFISGDNYNLKEKSKSIGEEWKERGEKRKHLLNRTYFLSLQASERALQESPPTVSSCWQPPFSWLSGHISSLSLLLLCPPCFISCITPGSSHFTSFIWTILFISMASPTLSPTMDSHQGGSDSKESACNAGDPGSIPGSGRSPGVGNGNPLQYSCLENSMDRGAWWATWSCRESDTTEWITYTLNNDDS